MNSLVVCSKVSFLMCLPSSSNISVLLLFSKCFCLPCWPQDGLCFDRLQCELLCNRMILAGGAKIEFSGIDIVIHCIDQLTQTL
jgi:hypothetical protein